MRALLCAAAATAAAGAKPHILYIVGDDYGYADADWHAGPGDARPKTPRMAALSAAGVRLESFYAQPICAATRASIMTGRYVQRIGYQHNNPPKAFGGVGAIPIGEKLMPEFMRGAGYKTHQIGKWHGGQIKEKYLPNNRGFDTAFGYYEGAIDYYKHTIGPATLDLHNASAPGDSVCVPEVTGTYDLDLWVTRAKEVLDLHDAAVPLFVYLALHSVHEPDECPQEWIDMYPGVTTADHRQTMLGMTTAMDTAVGDVVDYWHGKLGNNTVVLFHADNGGPTYAGAGALNYPLRGGKLTLWEGGVRVNAWAWSPLMEKAGRVETGLMHITDMLPTWATLGGAPLSGGKPLDGHDVSGALLRGEASPRTEILHLIDPLGNVLGPNPQGCEKSGVKGTCQNSSAIRVGDWKLIAGMYAACAAPGAMNSSAAIERACGWHRYVNGSAAEPAPASEPGSAGHWPIELPEPARPSAAADLPVVLFNISADPNERDDVSAQNPDVVAKLLSRIDEYAAGEWMDPQWPGYSVCDTPDGSCAMQRAAYIATAAKRGCCGPFVSGA